MPTGGVDLIAGAGALAGAFGSAAPIVGAGLAGLEGGAALGGLSSAVTGGNIGQGILHGAESGALTGGGIGLGGNLFGSTLGATAADAIGGAAGGALGGKLTGGNPLTGALEGGAAGALSGALSPSGAPSTTSAAPAGGGPVAGAASAPQGIPIDPSGLDIASLGQDPGLYPTSASSSPSLVSAGQQALGSSATSGTNVGSGNVGTSSLPGGGAINANTGDLVSGGTSLNPAAANVTKIPTSFDNFTANPSASTAFDVVKANPGAAISAAGLGIDALKQGQSLEGERQLEEQASNLAGQGAQLSNYLQSGTLPPGLQAGINQASESAKATIRSQYASRGMSGSSAEPQDLAAVDARAQAEGAQMAMQLLQTGISETGLASGLYEQILNQASKADAGLGSAISNFSTSLAGGGQSGKGGITVNYGQSA